MTTARLVEMSAADLSSWREDRSAGGRPLPERGAEDTYTAHEVLVDDVAVGGLVLTTAGSRCSVRELQTTLPVDAVDLWATVVAAIETHARGLGAGHLVTATSPAVARHFERAGFGATMGTLAKRLDPDSAPELQDDRRVSVRPMEPDERARFVAEAREFLASGMARSGVTGPDTPLDGLERRLADLVDDPPPTEYLMVGLVDGVPVGRAWATLRPLEGGGVDFYGNTLDLAPEHRGQGLTKSFLGALRRHVQEVGVRDVHLRVYGDDPGARATFLDNGMGVADVHLRKDL